MENSWFRSGKWAGWGYVPINWKGGLSYVVLFITIVLNSVIYLSRDRSSINSMEFLFGFILLLFAFAVFAKCKTRSNS